MKELRYPIGIQNFQEIRENGFVYVDKTRFIRTLVNDGKYYFLSRPRRFGKSLLLSTIHSFFEGRKDLFKGLDIESSENDWNPHPVFHIDLTGRTYDTLGSLIGRLDLLLCQWESEYGIVNTETNVAERFGTLIRTAHNATGQRVVILIDEYDKPLIDTFDMPELQESVRNELKGIYGNLKRMDGHIKFAMLTGVTKFGKLSVFSDINNLNDISLDDKFSDICGVNPDELKRYFQYGVEEFARKQNVTVGRMYELLKDNYDGYHFAIDSKDVYNPFSLLNALYKKRIGRYWFATGTPTFLVKRLKQSGIDLRELEDMEISIHDLENVSYSLSHTKALLYQSGYLTIKDYNAEYETVILDYPNREVSQGFLTQLMEIFTDSDSFDSAFSIMKFVDDVKEGRVEDFLRRLQSLYSDIHYDHIDLGNLERHFQNVLYLVMKLMGFYTQSEMRTTDGRIDLLISTPGYLYIIECKIDSSAETALEQINNKKYSIPYQMDGRQIYKIGINFSTTTRTISDWKIEK